jgi:hypothetical protein
MNGESKSATAPVQRRPGGPGRNYRLYRDGRLATLKELGYSAEEVVRTVTGDLPIGRDELAGLLATWGFSPAEAAAALHAVLGARAS